MKRLCAALLASLASACATMIDHQKVDGWPKLDIVETYLPHAQMRSRCAKYMGFGMTPLACAEFHLSAGKCYIWYSTEYPPAKFIIEHERLHCRGYDHVGANTMANLAARHIARSSMRE